MTTIQTEATAIVHAGLADVLAWLGETPQHPHRARHARPRDAALFHRLCSEEGFEVVAYEPPADPGAIVADPPLLRSAA